VHSLSNFLLFILKQSTVFKVEGATSGKAILALWMTDQPGCVLKNSFGLPAAPAFVALDKRTSMSLPTATSAISAASSVSAANNAGQRSGGGFASLPPMGYNTWNAIHTNVDENLILEIAQVIKRTGLADVGYQYVNIDDGWEVDRMQNGSLSADPVRFPIGIPTC